MHTTYLCQTKCTLFDLLLAFFAAWCPQLGIRTLEVGIHLTWRTGTPCYFAESAQLNERRFCSSWKATSSAAGWPFSTVQQKAAVIHRTMNWPRTGKSCCSSKKRSFEAVTTSNREHKVVEASCCYLQLANQTEANVVSRRSRDCMLQLRWKTGKLFCNIMYTTSLATITQPHI